MAKIGDMVCLKHSQFSDIFGIVTEIIFVPALDTNQYEIQWLEDGLTTLVFDTNLEVING